MNPYQQFGTDKNLETNGVVLDYGDFKITVARAGGSNKEYLKSLERKSKALRRKIQTGNLSNEQANEVLLEVFADTVVKGWEGVCDKDGNPLQFNRENVLKLLTDLPELFRDIQNQASEVELFREAQLKEEAGNS